jgi:hypothetical protein
MSDPNPPPRPEDIRPASEASRERTIYMRALYDLMTEVDAIQFKVRLAIARINESERRED